MSSCIYMENRSQLATGEWPRKHNSLTFCKYASTRLIKTNSRIKKISDLLIYLGLYRQVICFMKSHLEDEWSQESMMRILGPIYTKVGPINLNVQISHLSIRLVLPLHLIILRSKILLYYSFIIISLLHHWYLFKSTMNQD